METSNLENLSNTQLYFLLKMTIHTYNMDHKYLLRSDIMEDNGFIDSCESSARLMGFELEFPIDENYIAATIQLNPDYDFSEMKPSSELKRPKVGHYSFDIDEHRTEYVVRTYTHEQSSYSSDLLIPTVELMLSLIHI